MIEIILALMPVLIPLITQLINKPKPARNAAFMRRVVRFQKLANDADSSAERLAYGEIADIFGCLAEADDAGCREILAGLQQAQAGILQAAGAGKAV